MNLATRWLARHLGGVSESCGNQVCAICSGPCDAAVAVADVLRPTFTDIDRVNGDYVCSACVWYFDHQELRRSHWYLTPAEAVPLAKKDILPLLRKHVREPPPVDRYYLISRSKKKHVALRARLNAAGARMLRVNFETMLVDVDQQFFELYDHIVALRKYHAWDEIERDEYLIRSLQRWLTGEGFDQFERHRDGVRPWLRTQQYELAKFLYSPDQEEGEDEQT
jgi:hypothetical protein